MYLGSYEKHMEISVIRISDADLLSKWSILRDVYALTNSVRAKALGKERVRSLVKRITDLHLGEDCGELQEIADIILGLIRR